MSHPALAFGLGHLGTGRCVTAAKSRLPSRSHGFVAVRAQGDAATSGNRAAGEASPSTGTAKGPREGQKRGGQQVKGKPQARPTSEQDIRSTAPFPTRPNKPQAKKQPPPSALSQIQTSPFGKDPPGHKSGYVAIVGKPNAGKSTLLNAIIGQKLAIVTPKAQTTRHRIVGIMSGDMHQAIFLDTPGIMASSRNKLDTAMMKNVKTAINQGDVLLAIVDSAAALELDDPADGLEGLRSSATAGGPQLCVVLNKADLLDPDGKAKLEETYRALPGVDQVLFTCAKEGTGVQELADWVVSRLPMGPTLYSKEQVSEHPERFFVAEIVREHIFEKYQKEVPYCTTVRVLKHSERPGMKDVIKLRISVERETQKGILIGAGGAALKSLMTASRKAVEEFLEREVYMECEVVVDEDWRENDALVDAFGIAEASTIF